MSRLVSISTTLRIVLIPEPLLQIVSQHECHCLQMPAPQLECRKVTFDPAFPPWPRPGKEEVSVSRGLSLQPLLGFSGIWILTGLFTFGLIQRTAVARWLRKSRGWGIQSTDTHCAALPSPLTLFFPWAVRVAARAHYQCRTEVCVKVESAVKDTAVWCLGDGVSPPLTSFSGHFSYLEWQCSHLKLISHLKATPSFLTYKLLLWFITL